MRPSVRKKLMLAAAASTGLLGIVGYPAIKNVYPIKKQTTIVDDYVDLPTATADLTKDIVVPEGIGTGTDVPVDVSHWLLLSLLKSKNPTRRERALHELASQRRWNDAECLEIAQALDRQNIIRLARTVDADIRLFLPPPSLDFIEKTLRSNKIEKLIKTILKDVKSDSCSSCTNYYTNLSIRVRPDSNILAMSDFNQVDKMMRIESRKRKKSEYNDDIIKLKAVLNNIICGEPQALQMVQSGVLLALLYFRQKYKDDLQVNGLLSQIISNLALNQSTKEYLFTDGWIQTLTEYTRSPYLELSMPAFKALANLDEEAIKVNGYYGNHLYLLSPLYRDNENSHNQANFDVIFVHGLVGSIFKSWRQGSIALDEHGNRDDSNGLMPTTELLPGGPAESFPIDNENPTQTITPSSLNQISEIAADIAGVDETSSQQQTRCWPKDWLPEDVPNLRVLAVDYPTALSNWRTDCNLNKDTLRERAIHVMKQLEAANVGARPIIWVAHSMGGLLVKQILVICDEISSAASETTTKSTSNKSFKENLLKQTKGIVFYSVPHKGSNLDWIERRNLQKLLLLTTEVIELQKGSPILVDLHEKFLKLIDHKGKDLKFLTFFEDSISSFGVNKVVQWKGVLVHEDSLMFEIGPNHKLHIDHAHTCKPHSKKAITYIKTLDFIKNLVPSKNESKDEQLLPFISFVL